MLVGECGRRARGREDRCPWRPKCRSRLLGNVDPKFLGLGLVHLQHLDLEHHFSRLPVVRENDAFRQPNLVRTVADDDRVQVFIHVEPLALEHGP